MAIFRYKAVNAQGAFSEGQVDAVDTRTVVHRLRNMGLIPVSIEEPPSHQTALLPKKLTEHSGLCNGRGPSEILTEPNDLIGRCETR